jgi:P-type Ca2+ transporter type 2C
MISEDAAQKAGTEASAKPGHSSDAFALDLDDALTPDPGTEDTFRTQNNKFAFSPGQLSKMLNPKNHSAFYALGGLVGLEKGLRTNRDTGLSVGETTLDGAVTFEEVATKHVPRYSTTSDAVPESKIRTEKRHPSSEARTGGFLDRKRIFAENRLPEKKTKTLLDLAWQTYNDKVLILLTIAAVVSLALGLYQTFGGSHEAGEPRVEWIEGVAILVAIIIVVLVGTLNDCKFSSSLATPSA